MHSKKIIVLLAYTLLIIFVFWNLHCEPSILFSLYSASNLAFEKLVGDSYDTNEAGYTTGRNFTATKDHLVFRKFYIDEPLIKKHVNIIIIVSSAPKRIGRRNMIRKTWWTQCQETKSIKSECIFITDNQGPNDKYFHIVNSEKMLYDDIRFQLVESGVTFGKRFLYHLLFAETNYVYDYFLRVDDDQFLCLDKLLLELPYPVENRFHWGWIHLQSNIRRPEESIIMFSHDVVLTFLTQDLNSFFCHPLADQMIATWLSELNISSLLRHDKRIHHVPPIREVPYLKAKFEICSQYIAIHGVYNKEMLELWKHRGEKITSVNGNLKTNSIRCVITVPYNWEHMGEPYRFEPKNCVSDPKWNTSKLLGNSVSYSGRE